MFLERSIQKFVGAITVALAVAAWPSVAAAARPFTMERATLGAGLRFGSDDINLGLGARGGYTLRQQIYIGGQFDYWFGEEDDYGIPAANGSIDTSAWDLLAVGGYDFGLSPVVVVRPFGGLGVMSYNIEICGELLGNETCDDDSETEVAGTFGAELLLDLGGWNLGGEFRVIFSDETHAIIGANVGAAF
ncbi:MAG TPA: outer membrane beta-barrel protein [Polyangiaceae bacterium]|nr:outer membrane beta-barrel protein [Polyangiaceae bacterium]